MRITFLLLFLTTTSVAAVAAAMCARMSDAEQIMTSIQAGVFVVSVAVSFLLMFAYFIVGASQAETDKLDVIDEVANGILTATEEPGKRELLRLLEGSTCLTQGHRQAVVYGRRGLLDRVRTAIVLLEYSWDSDGRTRTRQTPIVVVGNIFSRHATHRSEPGFCEGTRTPESVADVPQARAGNAAHDNESAEISKSSTAIAGGVAPELQLLLQSMIPRLKQQVRLPEVLKGLLTQDSADEIAKLLAGHPDIQIEVRDNSLLLWVGSFSFATFVAGLRHPMRTHADTFREDLKMMLQVSRTIIRARRHSGTG